MEEVTQINSLKDSWLTQKKEKVEVNSVFVFVFSLAK